MNVNRLDELLAQAGWAKALARQLVRDDDSADELVQRTWIAALEHPPGLQAAPATLRRWIASVMRNFVRQDVRERDRRVQREIFAARPERAPDGALDGIEGQHKLLEALRALPDPYRSALYARYFEGLAPREIARRDGTALKTVKSQLARGLEQLRQRLDRDHGGDRSAWMVWILPMTAKSALPTALLGALIVNSKIKLAALLVVVVCLIAAGVELVRRDPTLPAQSLAMAPVTPPAAEEPALDPGVTGERESVRVADAASEAKPEVAALPASAPAILQGRVFDLENRPVGGVRIVYERRHDDFRPAPESDARSDERGYFDLPAEPTALNVLVDDPRWVTVYKAYLAGKNMHEATIFVAPRIELAGIVLDPTRRPVEGAEIELRLDASIKRNLERRLDGAYRQDFMATSDREGRFTFADAPACKGELIATAPGWLPATIPAPALASTDIEIVLAPREKHPAIVCGIVEDAEAHPIPDANVGIGSLTKTTGPDGRFTFDLDAQAPGDVAEFEVSGNVWRSKFKRDRLRVVKLGLMPREVILPPIDELRLDPTPREFKVVLDEKSLTIRGHVVDVDGKRLDHVQLTVLNETPFGPIFHRNGEAIVATETSIEQLLRGGRWRVETSTKDDGSFEVTGLTSRNYDLAALDPKTMRYIVVRAIAAGSSDVRIELPGNSSLTHVAGRVVSRAGSGLPGLDLHIGRMAGYAIHQPEFVRQLTTDSSGHFDLGTIDPAQLCIQVIGGEIFLIMAWQPPAGAKLDELEIQVSQRCPIKVELTPTAPHASAFSFIDSAGNPTLNLQFEGPMMSLPEHCAIEEGVSEVCATEDSATTMLLYQDGKEVARLPVHLTPGVLTILRP